MRKIWGKKRLFTIRRKSRQSCTVTVCSTSTTCTMRAHAVLGIATSVEVNQCLLSLVKSAGVLLVYMLPCCAEVFCFKFEKKQQQKKKESRMTKKKAGGGRLAFLSIVLQSKIVSADRRAAGKASVPPPSRTSATMGSVSVQQNSAWLDQNEGCSCRGFNYRVRKGERKSGRGGGGAKEKTNTRGSLNYG